MVIAKNYGRMGNVLFQNACCIAYSIKHGLEFTIPDKTNDRIWNPLYLQNLVNPKYDPSLAHTIVKEQTHAYHELPFYENWRDVNIILDGYFQSYKYFDWCWPEVRRLFNFEWEERKDPIVSLHIRRGDYLLYPDKHPVMSESYLQQAMAVVSGRGYNKFLVLSDDIPYCEEKFTTQNYPGKEFVFSKGRNEVEDMVIGSMCHHHIGSASTFAWWIAFLNRRDEKIVVTPDESSWFGPTYSNLDLSTLIPPGWIKIKY